MRKIVAAILLVGIVSCGPLRYIGENEPSRMLIQQRSEIDCGIAALAMTLRVWYDDVNKVVPPAYLSYYGGIAADDLPKFARTMNRSLVLGEYREGKDTGLLVIRWNDTKTGHAIFVNTHWAYDPLEAFRIPIAEHRAERDYTVIQFYYEPGYR